MNTLIIQQKDFSVNIVDTSKADGKQIVFSISVLAQARTQRNGKNIELYSIGGELLYILPFSGIKTQDIGGNPVAWSGTVDALLTKLNEEYFNNNVSGGTSIPNPLPITAASLPLPTGAAKESSLDAVLTELQLKANLDETQPVSLSNLEIALNAVLALNKTSIAVRPTDFNLMVAQGLYQNMNITIKDGLNDDVDTGSVPEDITNEGGIYAGFPTGAVEAGEIIVSGADTGAVYYSYMATATDTDYTFASKAIAGAGTYALGHNVFRSNFAYFVSSNPAVFNIGAITLRNTVTTTNVFWVIGVGFSQTYCAAYTVPFNSAVYIDRFNGNMRGSATGSLDGYIWYRPSGESPRLRFPFELQYGQLYFDDTDYVIKIPALVDFIPRITVSSANNLSAKLSYRLLKIKQ
jgi:hypothetical protein